MIGFKEVFTEDVFDFKYSGQSGNSTSYPQEIVLWCPNKRARVSGTLNNGIKVQGKAEWKDMMGGGIMSLAGSLVDTANNVLQWTNAESVQQPWMNRKMWVTSKPLTFQFSISFVEIENALKDVVQPCLALLSFVYPRQGGLKDEKGSEEATRLAGKEVNVYEVDTLWNKISNRSADGKYSSVDVGGMFSIDGTSLVGTTLNTIAMYHIPGPGLRHGTKSGTGDKGGDAVNIVVGNLLCLESCYIESVDIEFHNVLNASGYPIAGKANLTVTSADNSYCTTDGNFLLSNFKDSSQRLADFLDKFGQTTEDLKNDIIGVTKSVIGFWKPTNESDANAKQIQNNVTDKKRRQ